VLASNMSTYSPLEEKINIYSHVFGAILSTIALIFLFFKGVQSHKGLALFSYTLFGITLIQLYLASAKYHSEVEPKRRHKLKILDHSAIYVLIAGTYTPYALITIGGTSGWFLFSVIWTMAFIGIVLKLFFTGRFETFSTLMYVFMGWMVVFFAKSLLITLSSEGFYLLLAGGISYTIGAVIYSINKIKFNHAIFHFFVLGGSFGHFLSIYYFI